MTSKTCLTLIGAALFAAVSLSARAAPTASQQEEIQHCGIEAKAVMLFGQARDRGLSEPDAFKSVTQGQAEYVKGSILDQTEQWAFQHPGEDPNVLVAHFYGRCVLQVLDLLTPETEAKFDADVAACQKDHVGKPEEIRSCIGEKTQGAMDAANPSEPAPGAGTGASVASASTTPPPSVQGVGKITLGMPKADARAQLGSFVEQGRDDQGAPAFTYMYSHDHGFVVLYLEPNNPNTVYGMEFHGGADVDMEPVMGIRLGDSAFTVLKNVGQPSAKTRLPGTDNSVWTYDGRNYSFTFSSGGDLITIRVYGYDGLAQKPGSRPAP